MPRRHQEMAAVGQYTPLHINALSLPVNNHSGNYTIASLSGTFLGRVVIGAAGSGMTLTLYNGNPNVLPLPTKSGVITALTPVAGQPYIFDLACDYGLFYTYAGTTPGDVTIGYTDMPLS